MNRIRAIAGRELRAYFLSPSGYIIIALFLAITGLVFVVRGLNRGQPTSMRAVFDWGTWVLLFICPAISMRAISEERRLGTFELLMTSPVSEGQVILGKFLAAMGFLLVMLLPTVAHVVILEIYGRPDYGEVLCGYLGLVLAGGAYVASGILVSCLTASQAVAFLVPLFFWVALSVGTKVAQAYLPEPWAGPAFSLDPDLRLKDFSIGLIDSANVIYYAAIAGFFLIAATKMLSARRWR